MYDIIAVGIAIAGSLALLWWRLCQDKRHEEKFFYNRTNDLRQQFRGLKYCYYPSVVSRHITYACEIMRLLMWRYGCVCLWLWGGIWGLRNGAPFLEKPSYMFNIALVVVAFFTPAVLLGLAYLTVGSSVVITLAGVIIAYIGYGSYQLGGVWGIGVSILIGWLLIKAPGPCWCYNNWYWRYYYYYSDQNR